jgi:uncharacterized protein YndB with AHSA1/START domain
MQFNHNVWVNVPLDFAWTRVNDLRSAAEYMPFLQSAEVVGGGEIGVGKVVHMTFRRGAQTLVADATVTEYVPHDRIALTTEVPMVGGRADVAWRFRAENNGTRWGQEITLTFKNKFAEMAAQAMIGSVLNEDRILVGMETVKADLESKYRATHDVAGGAAG